MAHGVDQMEQLFPRASKATSWGIYGSACVPL